METTEEFSKLIEQNLLDVICLLEDVLKHNPYVELEKSVKIVKQRNYNQYAVIKSKVGDTLMRIYNTRFEKQEEIARKLNDIYILLT